MKDSTDALPPVQTTESPPLILASASPRRREILALLGYPFDVRPSHVEESFEAGTPPDTVVQDLALRKALEIASGVDEGIVIGSDTLVILPAPRASQETFDSAGITAENPPAILGKPANSEEALSMLLSLSGRWHEVHTGIALLDAKSGRRNVALCKTAVKMRSLPLDVLRRYVETGEPMDKAGAYAIQGKGAVLIEEIRGDYFNVVGLPLSLLSGMLGEFGFGLFPERG